MFCPHPTHTQHPPNATKWADLITTESDAEREHDKQENKSEKSKQTKDKHKTMTAILIFFPCIIV